MRVAGAAAKENAGAAAAAKQCEVRRRNAPRQLARVARRLRPHARTFGELAHGRPRSSAAPATSALKNPDSFTIRRTSAPRIDIPSKVDGSATYAIDFTLPGMLYAAIESRRCYGGKLVSVDTAPAEAMPGVKKVVKLENAVAVVADSFWRARQALAALKPEFATPGTRRRVDRLDLSPLRQGARRARRRCRRAPAKVVDRRLPRALFLAHATMEPMVCTAQVEGDRAEVWAGVQDPLNARADAAKALGIDAEHVTLHQLPARRRLRPPAAVHLRLRRLSARASRRRCRRRR